MGILAWRKKKKKGGNDSWELGLACIPLVIWSFSMYSVDRFAACVIVGSVVKRNREELQVCYQLVILSEINWSDPTFDESVLQMPTRSHKPTMYRPKFHPLWSPEIGLKPITSDLNFHVPSFTSIQWAVIPRKDAFVLSAVHPSTVNEIFPGAAWW